MWHEHSICPINDDFCVICLSVLYTITAIGETLYWASGVHVSKGCVDMIKEGLWLYTWNYELSTMYSMRWCPLQIPCAATGLLWAWRHDPVKGTPVRPSPLDLSRETLQTMLPPCSNSWSSSEIETLSCYTTTCFQNHHSKLEITTWCPHKAFVSWWFPTMQINN